MFKKWLKPTEPLRILPGKTILIYGQQENESISNNFFASILGMLEDYLFYQKFIGISFFISENMKKNVKKLFKKSIEEYKETHDLIHEFQKISNEIRSRSKRAIALLRRDNFQESEKIIKEVEDLFKLLFKKAKRNKKLARQGFYAEAVEEYIEAIAFYNFLTKAKRKISSFAQAGPEEIIAGICDFTGELVRKAITIAEVKNLKKLASYKKEIEDIAEELTKVGFKGKLRQKYDEAERNLKKIESIIYDIRLRK